MGSTANVGRLLGQGDTRNAARFSTHGLLLAVLLVTLASTLGYFTIEPLFRRLGASDDLLPLIDQYMQVWYFTIPLLVIPMAGNSVIRSTGDTKTPAKIMMTAGLINGALYRSSIFGYGPFPEAGHSRRGHCQRSELVWGISLPRYTFSLNAKNYSRHPLSYALFKTGHKYSKSAHQRPFPVR